MENDGKKIRLNDIRWDRIVQENKVPFITSLIAGFMAYGYIMLNMINNHDSINSFIMRNEEIEIVVSGRWLLQLLFQAVGKVWNNYNMPLFCGMVAVLLLAICSCIIVHTLRIRSACAQAALSAVFVVFPAIGASMLYMYTVHYYAFGVLLAVLGVWVAWEYRRGFLAAAVLFALSLGIYQAYMPLAASLLLVALIQQCVDGGNESAKNIFSSAVRYLLALLLGFGLYFVLMKVFLALYHTVLTDYMNINEMGAHLDAVPQLIIAAYKNFLLLPIRAQYDVNITHFIRLGMAVCMIWGGIGILLWLVRSRAEKGKKALAVLFLALFPLAVNGIYIMCNTTKSESMLSYATVAVFFLPLVVLQSCDVSPGEKTKKSSVASGVLTAMIFLSAVNYAWQANGNYMVQEYTNMQANMYFSTMLTRLESAEGYNTTLKLAMIGEKISDPTYANHAYLVSRAFRFRGINPEGLNIYSRDDWLHYYFGYNQPEATKEERETLAHMPEVEKMPCYPNDGSIQVIDDYLVLKLENDWPTE